MVSSSILFSLLATAISVLDARGQAQAAAVNGLTNRTLSMAWYTGWHAAAFPLSKVSWAKYDLLFYAFATTTPDPSVLSLQTSDLQLLPEFVAAAHQNGVKASLSVGGWTGSMWFSSNVGSAANRSIFVDAVTSLVSKFDLDGVDFDWEFPGKQGLECNTVNPNDTLNFLSFLQELRAHPLGANITISAPTSIVPFTSSAGTPSTDLSAFSSVLDFISIMNYDVWKPTTSLTAGPNSPLNDSCAAPQDRNGSAVSAVRAWNAAGIPLNNIVLGVAGYGHSFNVSPANAYQPPGGAGSELALFPPFNATGQPPGDAWDNPPGMDACGNPVGQGGIWQFWGLVQAGYLKSDGTPTNEVVYRYDNCSQTPYIYKEDAQILISYDNPESFAAKGIYVRNMGLRGFAIWEAGSDLNDSLLDTIRNAALDGDDPYLVNGTSTKTPTTSSAADHRTYTPWNHSFSFICCVPLILTVTFPFPFGPFI